MTNCRLRKNLERGQITITQNSTDSLTAQGGAQFAPVGSRWRFSRRLNVGIHWVVERRHVMSDDNGIESLDWNASGGGRCWWWEESNKFLRRFHVLLSEGTFLATAKSHGVEAAEVIADSHPIWFSKAWWSCDDWYRTVAAASTLSIRTRNH